MNDAPTPIIDTPILLELLEEKKLKLRKNNKKYIFSWAKTRNDSILFKMKLDSDLNMNYYELEYKSILLKNLSKLFMFCVNLDESYNLLTENLEQNKEEINFEFSKDIVDLSFKLNLPTRKKETVYIIMKKREINIDSLLEKFNSKINNIHENQTKFEYNINDNFIRINEIINNQNKIENIINDIKQIKNFYNELDKQKNKDNNIVKNQVGIYFK